MGGIVFRNVFYTELSGELPVRLVLLKLLGDGDGGIVGASGVPEMLAPQRSKWRRLQQNQEESPFLL